MYERVGDATSEGARVSSRSVRAHGACQRRHRSPLSPAAPQTVRDDVIADPADPPAGQGR
jgi:hypothetical protein